MGIAVAAVTVEEDRCDRLSFPHRKRDANAARHRIGAVADREKPAGPEKSLDGGVRRRPRERRAHVDPSDAARKDLTRLIEPFETDLAHFRLVRLLRRDRSRCAKQEGRYE